MATRWDGDVGKIGDFGSKREGKKISFRMPKAKRDENDYSCRQHNEAGRGTRKPREPGSADLYSPEVIYNYKSQYARYERALDLRPDAIQEGEKESFYKFHSCDAPTQFWTVTVKKGATFLKLDKSILTIVCPQPYQVKGESDGTSFIWEQLAGNRTVTFSPETELNTTINMLNTCIPGTGCDDGTSLPIILKVSVEGEPELFDNLIIFNTPTSSLYGNSFKPNGVGTNPNKIINFITPAPILRQGGYAVDAGELVNFTWNLPVAETKFVVATTWQINTNGQYVDLERFPIGEPRLFDAEQNTYYRIKTEFLIEGFKREVTFTPPIFIETPGKRRLVFGDDTQRGVAFAKVANRSVKVTPEFRVLELTSRNRGIAFASRRSGARRGEQIAIQNREVVDTYRSAISFASSRNSYSKEQLGGIVIG